ncbi:MAG: helix-turn-helix domain-containing protein [Tannerella sp.]|nr:helix-turn-helix domain-containing protein [Tannerella sp.]
MSIGIRVRKYRDSKHLSQRMLAEKVEVSQSVISSIESDKSIPNAIMLNRIAKVLDVDINDFLVDDGIDQNNNDNSIDNFQSQTAIHNHFPENVLELLSSNQEKIATLLETQNKLMELLLKNII